MAINFVLRAKKNPATKVEKTYAQNAPSTAVDIKHIARAIEQKTTVSPSDVLAVLNALQREVIENLKIGHSVRLGDLGSFRLTIQSRGASTPEEARKRGASLIKGVKVQFTKSTTMRDELDARFLSFQRADYIAEEGKEDKGTTPPTPKTEEGNTDGLGL